MPRIKETPIVTHSELDEINFAVTKVTTKELFSDTKFADNLTHAIYSPEHNKVLSFCSKDYGVVENDQLFTPILDTAKECLGGEVDITVKSYDGRRFYMDIVGDKRMHNVTKNDKVCPLISVKNSYDGTVKQGYSLSFYRQICSNGMKGFAKEYSFESKHSSERKFVLNLDRLRADLLNVKNQIEQFKAMSDRPMTSKELEAIMEHFKESKAINYPKRLIEEVPEIIGKEIEILKAPMSAWLVYNGFNNALMHADTKMLPEEKEKIDRRVLNFIQAN